MRPTRTPKEDYVKFIEKVQAIVKAHGKRVIGWEEIGQVDLLPGTVAQYWNTNSPSTPFTQQAVLQGAKIIISPADRAYLDMKYDANTPLGLDWAGRPRPELPTAGTRPAGCWAYPRRPSWAWKRRCGANAPHPAGYRIHGLSRASSAYRRDRLVAGGLNWDEYRERLAAQAPRLARPECQFLHRPRSALGGKYALWTNRSQTSTKVKPVRR